MTTKEERIEELKFRVNDYERYIRFEIMEIEKTERKIKDAELRVMRLELQKRTMQSRLKEYEVLLKANQARLNAHNQG
jgi:hypothetical protein